MSPESSGNKPASESAAWSRVPRAAVLLSGSGRTLQNLLDTQHRGMLDIEIVAVVSSKPGVRGLAIAADAEIPCFVVQRRDFPTDDAFTTQIESAIRPLGPDMLILAGFLRRLVISDAWAGRVLNIHPALLPEMAAAAGQGFYGDKVHAEVLRQGAEQSGATVHIVDSGYDTGPVLARSIVLVEPGDTVETLAGRVFAAECELYPRVINEYVHQNRDWLMRVRR